MNIDRISLDSCIAVVEKIIHASECSTGPNSLNALLCTNDGKVFLTKSVTDILHALNLNHPLEKLLINSVLCYIDVTGDDSNSFLIFLQSVLINMRNELRKSSQTLSQALFNVAARKLFNEAHEILPKLADSLTEYYEEVPCKTGMEAQIWNNVMNIIKAALVGKFTRKSISVVTSLVTELLKKSIHDVSTILKVTEHLISLYDKICIEIPEKLLSDSKVISGLLLQYSSRNHVRDVTDEISPSVIVLLDTEENDYSSDIVSMSTNYDLVGSMMKQAASLGAIVSKLSLIGVNMILCSGNIPDEIFYECAKRNIHCLCYVDEEDFQMLSELTNTPIYKSLKEVTSLSDCLSVTSSKILILGSNIYLYLHKLPAPSEIHNIVNPSQLMICAPTIKLCHTYKIAILNCLKLVYNSFELPKLYNIKSKCTKSQNLISMTTIKVGGVFELSCIDLIESMEISNQTKCILKQGLLSLLTYILRHSYVKRQGQLLKEHLQMQVTKMEGLTCIDRQSGRLVPVDDVTNIEPVVLKLTLISHVFQLILQLSRLDQIVYVDK